MRLEREYDGGREPADGGRRALFRYLRAWGVVVAFLAIAVLVAANSTRHGMPVLRIAGNFLRSWSAHPVHLQVGMKFEDLQQLAYKRAQALDSGILITSEDDFVPARVQCGDEEYKARIRLKGDWVADNLEADKWSFRVALKGDHALFGLKQFSLHQPKVRNYIYEWIFHRALSREGIVALRTYFVRVSLNGKDLGIYSLEEHFDKRLIEHNSRREGVILKFNEDVRWRDARAFWPRPSPTNLSAMEVAEIDAFKTGSVMADSSLRRQYLKAENLLEQFRTGQLPPGEVFDITLMARYFAMVDLLGGLHALSWHNLRFYYNPITSLLEPIGFDAMAGTPTACLTASASASGAEANSFMKRLFDNDAFFESYVAECERMAVPEYLDELLREIDDSLQASLNVIYSEYPDFNYSPKVLYDNQRLMRASLNPVRCLNAYVTSADSRELRLEIADIQAMPVEIVGLSVGDTTVAPNSSDRTLRLQRPVAYRGMTFPVPAGTVWSDSLLSTLKVVHRVIGSSLDRTVSVIPRPRLVPAFSEPDLMRRPPNFRQTGGVQVNEAEHTVTIGPGPVVFRETLVVPAGYRVYAAGGTDIDLQNSSLILSYSPIVLSGTGDRPVRVHSSDSTGQGLLVANADDESTIKCVIFENLRCPSQGAWELTGAVTFYRSKVRLDSCVFKDIRSEDGLNVVRSEMNMSGCLFVGCAFDSFDGDFVTGLIADCQFRNGGNDGVDVSGSEVVLERLTIVNVGDKGVSAGEGSNISGRDIEVADSNIGVASKDRSSVRLSGVKIKGCAIGLAAYQKKPEFGEATLALDDLTLTDNRTLYLIEEGSSLRMNGQSVGGAAHNVYDSLYSDAGGL